MVVRTTRKKATPSMDNVLQYPLQHGYPLPDPEDIAAFEREAEIQLPQSYKEFLANHNGGFFVDTVGIDVGDRFVEVVNFIPLETDVESGLRLVVRAIALDGGLFPRSCLPIAHASGGEEICITDVRLGGRMALALTSYNAFEEPERVDVSPLAESFDDFLGKLRRVERVVPQLIELAARGDEARLLDFLQLGGSIDTVSDEGETLICEAIGHLNVPMVKACIKHGASLKATVHAALRVRSPELLDLVIAAGANPLDLDRLGRAATSDLGGMALPGEFGKTSRILEEKLHSAIKQAKIRSLGQE
jgi:hypothetical protein